jgi:hypothetical protein
MKEIGTMNDTKFNCNATSELVYPYSLSPIKYLPDGVVTPENTFMKGNYKSKMLPSGDLRVWKQTYLCIDHEDEEYNYEEGYFDFKCLDKPPAAGEWWYTVCGTPYDKKHGGNFSEYWHMIVSACCLSLTVFTQVLSFIVDAES